MKLHSEQRSQQALVAAKDEALTAKAEALIAQQAAEARAAQLEQRAAEAQADVAEAQKQRCEHSDSYEQRWARPRQPPHPRASVVIWLKEEEGMTDTGRD